MKSIALGILILGAAVIPLVFVVAAESFALPKTLVSIAVAAALVLVLDALFARRAALPRPYRLAVVLAAYLAWMTVATVLSSDRDQSVLGLPHQYQGLLASLAYATAFVAAWAIVTSRARTSVLMRTIVGVAVVVAAYGIVQQLRLDPFWNVLDKGRIFSSIGQANALAAYLLLAFPLALALAASASGRERWLLVGVSILIVGTLLLTLSRGGLVGLIVAALTMALLLGTSGVRIRPSHVTPRLAIGVTSLVGVVAVLVVLLPPVQQSIGRAASRLATAVDATESSAADRIDMWAVAIRIAVEHPIVGVGPERYRDVFPQYRDEVLPPARAEFMKRFRPESPHNVALATLDAGGIPAFLLYAALIGLVLVQGVRALRRGSPHRALLIGLLGAAAGHVATDLFMTAEVTGSWLFWVILGSIAGLCVPALPSSQPIGERAPRRPEPSRRGGRHGRSAARGLP